MGTVPLRFSMPVLWISYSGCAEHPGFVPVGWWEDDGQEDDDAAEVWSTVNGDLSLAEARMHYSQCGASHPRFVRFVRKPEVTEQ
jgi:hypothetical protein